MKTRVSISAAEAVPEREIVIVSPHYDDVPCAAGNLLLDLRASGEIGNRSFRVEVVFSLSNFRTGDGEANYSRTRSRIAEVTGQRILEDLSCLDDLLGVHNYEYILGGEEECLVRGNRLTDDAMEFPHGMYSDFDAADWAILERLEGRFRDLLAVSDRAVLVPIAFREHRDHFLVREAAARARAAILSSGSPPPASLCFLEDKPYAGLADGEERGRIATFIAGQGLDEILFPARPVILADLIERKYPSQYGEIYRTGILAHAAGLSQAVTSAGSGQGALDRLHRYPSGA